MRFNVSKTSREKYSEIEITWWELEEVPTSSFMWWLPDVETFSVGDEDIRVPITEAGGEDDETKIVYDYISPITIYSSTHLFPVKNTQSGTKISMICIWGEEDNMSITANEFSRAGGSVSIDYDPTTLTHELVITPPQMLIGVNKDFSVTLEGSVPSAVIAGYGMKFHKRKQKVRTTHYGKVHSILEVELPYVTDRNTLYNVMQRLLEKYSASDLKYTLEYTGRKIPQLDNNNIVPQSVSVDSHENFSSSDGFQYNSLGSLTGKTLGEISRPDISLAQYQYYLKAYAN